MIIATSSSIPGEPGGEALPPVGGRISRGSNEAVRGSGGTSACWGIGFCVVALLILAKSKRSTRSRSSQVRSRMSTRSSADVVHFHAGMEAFCALAERTGDAYAIETK